MKPSARFTLNWANVKELPELSGVYICRAPSNGVYIGSTQNLKKRFHTHSSYLHWAMQFAMQGYMEFFPMKEGWEEREIELIKEYAEMDDVILMNKQHNRKRSAKYRK